MPVNNSEMSMPGPELLAVMPVFNEEVSLPRVVAEWFPVLDRVVSNFVLLAIDDGSRDSTLKVLKELQAHYGPRFEIISRENRGHGQSCVQGYRLALERNVPFVFQLDSDGQCDPRYFEGMWRMREAYDVIYGKRVRREDGAMRSIVSFVLRSSLLMLFQVNCTDANVPYRLMRTMILRDHLPRIPVDLHLVNIGLAVLLRKDRRVREGGVPIVFRNRFGGEPSVKFMKFASKAIQLFRQLRGIS
jgi:dolichol-phosphate mannosyltransferase